jgi:hypothetical protein
MTAIRDHRRGLRAAAFVLAMLSTAAGLAEAADAASDVAVKAALLFNFAKFAEWPLLAAGERIAICVAGDDAIAAALTDIVREQKIGGRSVELSRPRDGATWQACHVLFIAAADARKSAASLDAIRLQPVLTVGDGKGFAGSGGIIETYLEGGRMRFAINVDALERSGLHLSSRLLGLARVIRDHSAPAAPAKDGSHATR